MNETTKDLSTLLERAFSLSDQGDASGALDVLQSAVERWPDSALVHATIGLRCNELGRFAEAETACRRSLAVDRQPHTLTILAYALHRQARNAESVVCLREALALDPNYEEVHYNLGCHLRFAGDLDAAVDCFQRAIDIDPDYALAHAELGFALMLRRSGLDDVEAAADTRRALRHLHHSVAIEPNYHWSRLYLGDLLWILGRVRQARVHYEAATRIAPESSFVLGRYADFLSTVTGARQGVEPRFAKAIALDPDDPSARYYYGRHLQRAGRCNEVRRELLLADRLGHQSAREALHRYDDDPETFSTATSARRTRSRSRRYRRRPGRTR